MNRLRLCVRNLVGAKSVKYEGQRTIKRWVAPTLMEISKRQKEQSPQPEPKRSNFLEWNRSAELYAFNKRLSENFSEAKLEQAFTFKSYIIEEENKQKKIGIEDPKIEIEHNERLILEGRLLTSQVVKKYLSKSLPRVPETGIMAFHDYLMSEEVLANASLHIGTKDIILCDEHPVSKEILASTFLALVGALAESVDASHAGIFVRDFLITVLAEKDLAEVWSPAEPMEVLNSILFQESRAPVEPRLIGHAGRNTILSSYQIAVYSDKKFLGSGFGQTLDEAKNVAATNALFRMFGLLESSRPIKFNMPIDIST